jgi:hypothetical protein
MIDRNRLTFVEHAEAIAFLDAKVLDRILRFVPALDVGRSSTIRAPRFRELNRMMSVYLVWPSNVLVEIVEILGLYLIQEAKRTVRQASGLPLTPEEQAEERRRDEVEAMAKFVTDALRYRLMIPLKQSLFGPRKVQPHS